MQSRRTLYCNTEIVKVIRYLYPNEAPSRNNTYALIEKNDGTQIPANIEDLDLLTTYITATLQPISNDAESQKYMNQEVTILCPVGRGGRNSTISYEQLGITDDKPAFVIRCENGHEAIAFCDELIIDGTKLSNTINIYYKLEQKALGCRNFNEISFCGGPENDENIIIPIINDIEKDLQLKNGGVEGAHEISNNITRTDIENTIKKYGGTPRDMRLLDDAYIFYVWGIGA